MIARFSSTIRYRTANSQLLRRKHPSFSCFRLPAVTVILVVVALPAVALAQSGHCRPRRQRAELALGHLIVGISERQLLSLDSARVRTNNAGTRDNASTEPGIQESA